MTDKRDLPLTLLQEFRQLKLDCQDIQIEHADILKIEFEPFSIFIHDSSSSGKFYFNITRPILDQNSKKGMVSATYKPQHQSEPREHSLLISISGIAQILQNWLTLVIAYNSISMDVNDRFLEAYETNFYSDYKILDEGADSKPFDDHRQRLLEYTLEGIEEAIQVIDAPAERKKEILEDVADLKNKISSLTKNQVIRRFARISAKIKLKGYDFFTSFYEEVPKTIAKIFAEKGVKLLIEEMPKLLHHLFS